MFLSFLRHHGAFFPSNISFTVFGVLQYQPRRCWLHSPRHNLVDAASRLICTGISRQIWSWLRSVKCTRSGHGWGGENCTCPRVRVSVWDSSSLINDERTYFPDSTRPTRGWLLIFDNPHPLVHQLVIGDRVGRGEGGGGWRRGRWL
jgi:hypothetical protein